MKVLILGATGFIGGHIAKAALAEGWRVYGLRRKSNFTGHLGNLPVEWLFGDLSDLNSLSDAMQDKNVVFHAAAFYPADGNHRKVSRHVERARAEINNVLRAASQANIHRFIYTSSLTTIGLPPQKENRLADERDFYKPGTLPKSAYYESKIVMEQAVLDAAHSGVPATILNPTAVFGPESAHLGFSELLLMVARGNTLAWIPASTNIVDVRDVAQAHIQAVNYGRVGERYIIGGHNLTVREALSTAASLYNQKPPRLMIPLWAIDALVKLGDMMPFLAIPSNHLRAIRHWQVYNTDKTRRELGYTPRPLETTFLDIYTWLQERGFISLTG